IQWSLLFSLIFFKSQTVLILFFSNLPRFGLVMILIIAPSNERSKVSQLWFGIVFLILHSFSQENLLCFVVYEYIIASNKYCSTFAAPIEFAITSFMKLDIGPAILSPILLSYITFVNAPPFFFLIFAGFITRHT